MTAASYPVALFGTPPYGAPGLTAASVLSPLPANGGGAHHARYFQTFASPARPRAVDANAGSHQRHTPAPVAAFAQGVGLIMLGLMLNRIPPRPSAFELVSTRVEDWAKMALGVIATDKFNAAFDAKPPAWLQGLETVTALTFISQGLQKKGWKHFPLLALGVPALVQVTQWASEQVDAALDERQSDIPRWIPKTALGIASTVAGVLGLRGVIQSQWYRSAIGRLSGDTAAGQVVGAEAVVCSRCGGAHLLCMEEISDFVGVMASWAHDQFKLGNAHS